MKVSKRYSQFDAEVVNLLQHLAFHFERLGVSLSQVLDVVNWHDRYAVALKKYLDPQQHNPAIVVEMSQLYKEGVRLVAGIRQQIKNDASITFYPDEYFELGIHIDKQTRTKPKKPTTAPLLVEIESKPHENKFQAVASDKIREYGYRLGRGTRLLIKTAYSADAKPKAKDYKVAMESGRATFTIVAPPELPKGTRGFIRAAFVNSRGEIGPYGKPLEFVVN